MTDLVMAAERVIEMHDLPDEEWDMMEAAALTGRVELLRDAVAKAKGEKYTPWHERSQGVTEARMGWVAATGELCEAWRVFLANADKAEAELGRRLLPHELRAELVCLVEQTLHLLKG